MTAIWKARTFVLFQLYEGWERWKKGRKEEANYWAEPFKKFALSSKTADGGDMEKSKVGDDSRIQLYGAFLRLRWSPPKFDRELSRGASSGSQLRLGLSTECGPKPSRSGLDRVPR